VVSCGADLERKLQKEWVFFPKMNGYHFVISRKNNPKSNPFWKNLRFKLLPKKTDFRFSSEKERR
jgi:hypothetical protein